MNSLQKNWMREVQQSRIVVRPSEDAYIGGVDVRVWDIVHSIANGISECQLMETYPALTKEDIRACSLFVYLEAIGQI